MTELNANKRQVFISYATNSWIKKETALAGIDRYEEALQAYEKALELSPDNSDAWNRKDIALK
jgi:tetratricopeptide (TPR) repeat protein